MILLFSAGQDDRIAGMAKALGHPARVRILRLLQATPGCIGGDIVEAVGLAQSTVSEHLRPDGCRHHHRGNRGPRVCYAVSPGVLSDLSAFIGTLTPSPDGACCLPARRTSRTRRSDAG